MRRLVLALSLLLCVSALASGQTLRVTADTTNLRGKPAIDGAVVAALSKGDELEVIERAGTWYRVRVRSSGREGYVNSLLVETVSAAQIPGTSAPPPPARPTPVPPPPPARPTPVPPPPAARAPAAPRAPQSRVFIAAGAVFQSEKASFTDARTLTYNRESASQTGEYAIDGGVGADLAGFARIWRHLGAGVAVTQVTRAGDAAFSVRSPHPFFFSQPRSATTSASNLDRIETGVHVSAAYLLPSSGQFGLTVFGGPSFFSIEQTAVDDLTITETYPYDTIALVTGAQSDISESAVGFHVGADATWYVTRRLGAGALLRYTSAKKNVAISTGESFDLEAGGLQIGVGLRFKF